MWFTLLGRSMSAVNLAFCQALRQFTPITALGHVVRSPANTVLDNLGMMSK
jgi:hypothetical protein